MDLATGLEVANLIDEREKQKARIAALEAALRRLVAWEGAIEIAAPELGGCMQAIWDAKRVLGDN